MQIEISMQSFNRSPEDIFFNHFNTRPSNEILKYLDQERQSITYKLYGEFIAYNINYRNSILLSDLIYLSEQLGKKWNNQYLFEVERLIREELCKANLFDLQSLSEYNLLLVETNQFAKYQYGFKVINLGSQIKSCEDNIIKKINRITLNAPNQKINEALFPYLRMIKTFSSQQEFEKDTAKLRGKRENTLNIEKLIDFDTIKRETICHQYFISVQYINQKMVLNQIASIVNQYWINIEQCNLTTFQKYLIYAIQFSFRDTEQLKIIYHNLKTLIPYLEGTNDYYKSMNLLTQIHLNQNFTKQELINIINSQINEQQLFFPKSEATLNILKYSKSILRDGSYYFENQQSELMHLYQQEENKFFNKTNEFQFIKDMLACEFINNCQNITLPTFFKYEYEQLKQTIYDKFFVQLVKIEQFIQQMQQNDIEQHSSLFQYTFIKTEFEKSRLTTLKAILNLKIISEINVAEQQQQSEIVQTFSESLLFSTLNQINKSFYHKLQKLEEQVEQQIQNWILQQAQNDKKLEKQIKLWVMEAQIKEKVFVKLYSIWNPNIQESEIEAIIRDFDQQLTENLQNLEIQPEVNLDEEEIQELLKLEPLYSQEPVSQLNLEQLKLFIRNKQISYLKIESNKLAESLKTYLNNLNPKIINENDLTSVENQIKSIKLSLNLPLSKFCEEQEQQMLYLPTLAAVKIKFYQLFWINQGEKKIISIYQKFAKFDLSQLKIKLKVYFSDQELSEANISNLTDSLTAEKIKMINASPRKPIKQINPQQKQQKQIIKLVKNMQVKVINPDNQTYIYNLKEQEYLNREQINLYKFQKQSIYQNDFCNSSLKVEEFFQFKFGDLIRQSQFQNQNIIEQLDQFYAKQAHPLILSIKFQNQLEKYSYIIKYFKCILKNQFYTLIDQKTYEELKIKQDNVYNRIKYQLQEIVLKQQQNTILQYNKKIDLFQKDFEESYNIWEVKQQRLSQIILQKIKEQAIMSLQLQWTPMARINFDSILNTVMEEICNEK